MIEKLQESKDQLVRKFSEWDICPFKIDNWYHSPKESEIDQSDPTGRRIIVTRDLKWQSDTVSNITLLLLIMYRLAYFNLFSFLVS